MRIFLSYRRKDPGSIPTCKHLHDLLVEAGHEVFWDEEKMPPGREYPGALQSELERADAVIAVIHDPRKWAAPKLFGGFRLQEPDDWVRREILHAMTDADTLFVRLYLDGAGHQHPELLDREIREARFDDFQSVPVLSRNLPQGALELVAKLRTEKWKQGDYRFREREIEALLGGLPVGKIPPERILLYYLWSLTEKIGDTGLPPVPAEVSVLRVLKELCRNTGLLPAARFILALAFEFERSGNRDAGQRIRSGLARWKSADDEAAGEHRLTARMLEDLERELAEGLHQPRLQVRIQEHENGIVALEAGLKLGRHPHQLLLQGIPFSSPPAHESPVGAGWRGFNFRQRPEGPGSRASTIPGIHSIADGSDQ